ncbi:MAG: alpha/beta hydrolase [Clostridia bacterium]|nr:alpha/beta hydrolase [Clostridia bacterium]
MGLIVNIYKKNFLKRYDRDEAVPYYSAKDFPGLKCTRGSFLNSEGVMISHFIYWYKGYDPDRLILFCPGMGPGHAAYFAEIETLCRAGYRVWTLDYTGCGESGGERLSSVNAPTRDVMEMLERNPPREEVIPVGHSLGGYTALSVSRLAPNVRRAVILSGFVTVADEMMGFVKLRFLANRVKRYEEKLLPRYGRGDNRAYLATTQKRILWIHSTDDPMVNYKYNAGCVIQMGNPYLRVISVEGKRHNPQYSKEALETMSAWFGQYNRLLRENKLATAEERADYFADKPISMMTRQDPEIYREILSFLRS